MPDLAHHLQANSLTSSLDDPELGLLLALTLASRIDAMTLFNIRVFALRTPRILSN